jgi:hypothetical protein
MVEEENCRPLFSPYLSPTAPIFPYWRPSASKRQQHGHLCGPRSRRYANKTIACSQLRIKYVRCHLSSRLLQPRKRQPSRPIGLAVPQRNALHFHRRIAKRSRGYRMKQTSMFRKLAKTLLHDAVCQRTGPRAPGILPFSQVARVVYWSARGFPKVGT